MRKAGSILIIFALIFLPLFSLLSFSLEADLVTQVEVTMNSMCEVDVSPGSSANATITGNVSCINFYPSSPVVVNLTVNYSMGTVSLNKTQIVFQGSHNTEEIEVYVQLPTLTSAHEIKTCVVSGYWEQGTTNGTATPGEFMVVPLICYRFTIFSNDSVMEVTQGESAYFNVNITNTGNFEDCYVVNVTNREELESSNLNIPILPTSTLVEGGTKTIMLAVHTSSDTPVGDYQIHVNVTSVGSEGEGEEIVFEEYTLTVTVKGESTVNDGRDDEGEENLIVPLILLIVAIIIIILAVIFRKRKKTKGGSQ